MYICQLMNAAVWMPPHTKQIWNAILRHAVSSINKWFRFIHPNIRYTESLILFPLNPLVNSIFRPVNEKKKNFFPLNFFFAIFLFQSFPLFIFFILFFHSFSFILLLSKTNSYPLANQHFPAKTLIFFFYLHFSKWIKIFS